MGRGTLDHWVAETGQPKLEPMPLQHFLRYGDWFLDRFVPEADEHDVALVDGRDGGYLVGTTEGQEVEVGTLVIAVGVTPFPRSPAAFRGVDDPRISYAIQYGGYERFRGQRTVIVGGGQNGLESALMASRHGAASVEVIVRSQVRWYAPRESYQPRGPIQRRLHDLAYPIIGFGPPPINRLVLYPDLFYRLPASLRDRLDRRLLRPGGAPWIRGEVEGRVPISEGLEVTSVEIRPDAIVLGLSDGSTREVDEIVVATGYRFDVDRLAFLAPDVRRTIEIRDGWPHLDREMRSTNPSILFAGFPAEGQFGPLARFVEGTRFAATRIASALDGASG
jgi:hypothetical protein